MLRGLILVMLVGGLALLALPFVMTSQALEEHGVPLKGKIWHKREDVGVRYSGWERSRDISIEYTIPETGGVSFLTVHPEVSQYDALHTGQPVELRYLLEKDIPKLPLSNILWQLHALPTVRFIALRKASLVESPRDLLLVQVVGCLTALLLLWGITRWKPFGWTFGIALLLGLGVLELQDFPRPVPAPVNDLRHATGHVQSISHITNLFSSSRERGVIADQPVDVVGVAFLPEGFTEPVLAVDLIDLGSVPGLKEKGTVSITYEQANPRIASIDKATRTFPQRNFSGVIYQGVASLVLLLGVLALVAWLSAKYKKFTSRVSTR